MHSTLIFRLTEIAKKKKKKKKKISILNMENPQYYPTFLGSLCDEASFVTNYTIFYNQRFFSAQTQCCLTF